MDRRQGGRIGRKLYWLGSKRSGRIVWYVGGYDVWGRQRWQHKVELPADKDVQDDKITMTMMKNMNILWIAYNKIMKLYTINSASFSSLPSNSSTTCSSPSKPSDRSTSAGEPQSKCSVSSCPLSLNLNENCFLYDAHTPFPAIGSFWLTKTYKQMGHL